MAFHFLNHVNCGLSGTDTWHWSEARARFLADVLRMMHDGTGLQKLQRRGQGFGSHILTKVFSTVTSIVVKKTRHWLFRSSSVEAKILGHKKTKSSITVTVTWWWFLFSCRNNKTTLLSWKTTKNKVLYHGDSNLMMMPFFLQKQQIAYKTIVVEITRHWLSRIYVKCPYHPGKSVPPCHFFYFLCSGTKITFLLLLLFYWWQVPLCPFFIGRGAPCRQQSAGDGHVVGSNRRLCSCPQSRCCWGTKT